MFNGRGYGTKYGPTFTTGDVAGVWYNRVDHTITFTKNGRSLGIAFRGVPDLTYYPSVGFRTPDEEVR